VTRQINAAKLNHAQEEYALDDLSGNYQAYLEFYLAN
jgi:hypothetical protein